MKHHWQIYYYMTMHNHYLYRRELEQMYGLPEKEYTIKELWVEHVVKNYHTINVTPDCPAKKSIWKRLINFILRN